MDIVWCFVQYGELQICGLLTGGLAIQHNLSLINVSLPHFTEVLL